MPKTLVAALMSAGLLALLPTPSQAFWQRGQISACSDAVSEAERIRLRCWELDPYAATLPSPVGLDITRRGSRSYPLGHPSGYGAPYGGPVARRLG